MEAVWRHERPTRRLSHPVGVEEHDPGLEPPRAPARQVLREIKEEAVGTITLCTVVCRVYGCVGPWSPPLAQVIATEDYFPAAAEDAEEVRGERACEGGLWARSHCCRSRCATVHTPTPALGSYARFTERIGASIFETTM